ncbi:MAG: Ig-like domain-containing protein, partial [Anaerolineales bacterium]
MRVIHQVLVMLLVLAMVACTTPTVPLPTAVPTFGPGGQTATAPATSTGEEVSTEPAEGATPGKVQATGPSLASATPTPGQELALDGRITFVFDEDMDPASVKQALRVEPEIDLELE